MRQFFISYASEDNKRVNAAMGWVSKFYEALDFDLRRIGVTHVKLWRDVGEIAPYEQFADEIEEGLEGSDILISVLSPVYIQRDWCTKELCYFAEIRGDKSQTEKEAIIKVVKWPIDDRNDEPEPLRGQRGYRFYTRDMETGHFVDYYHPGKKKPSNAFYDEVLRLAQDLKQKLRDAPAVTQPAASAAKGTVFLGFATGDLESQIRQARGELEASDFTVLPERNATPPMEHDALLSMIEDGVANSDHAVLFLGRSPGFIPEGGETPILEMQLDVARRAGVRRTIWVAPGEHAAPVAHLIEDLRSGATLQPGDELIEEGFDRLKGHLAGLGQEPAIRTAPDQTALLAALIDSLDPDQRESLLGKYGAAGQDD